MISIWLLSLTDMQVILPMSFHGLIVNFFLMLNISLFGCPLVYLPITYSRTCWLLVVFGNWLQSCTYVKTFMCKGLGGHRFSLIWVNIKKYNSGIIRVCLVLWEIWLVFKIHFPILLEKEMQLCLICAMF